MSSCSIKSFSTRLTSDRDRLIPMLVAFVVSAAFLLNFVSGDLNDELYYDYSAGGVLAGYQWSKIFILWAFLFLISLVLTWFPTLLMMQLFRKITKNLGGKK